MEPEKNKNSNITIFQMAMLITVAVASIHSLPAMGKFGWSSIILWIIPALMFFIPTALISAELSQSFKGGIFGWVTEAFGKRWGFTAVWIQWVHNLIWYPTVLAFAGIAFASFIGMPNLGNYGIYAALFTIVCYWGSVFLALRGGNLFARFSSLAGVIGTLIPAGILVVIGVIIFAIGSHGHAFTLASDSVLANSHFLPQITGLGSISLIMSNVFAYAGMELNAVHADDLENPRRDYTKAITLSFVLILAILMIPTIALGVGIPVSFMKDNAANGVTVALGYYFNTIFHLPWMNNIIELMMFLGAMASVVTWISGPSRGLFIAAKTGLLPVRFQQTNKNGAQSGILIPQAGIVTVLACTYLIFKNVNDVFVLLVGMTVALDVIMYFLMFAASVKLRNSGRIPKDSYRAPLLGLLVALGMISCIATEILALVPSSTETTIPKNIYPIAVLAVVLVLGLPPLFFYAFRKPSWKLSEEESLEFVETK